MSILSELVDLPGVIAAGEYSYRGDRSSFKGDLTEETARQASIMCRAATMSVHMQGEILWQFHPRCGLSPARGWENMTDTHGFHPINGFSLIGLQWSAVTSGNHGVILENQGADYQAAFTALEA